jgi:signal transduction histidine kinase
VLNGVVEGVYVTDEQRLIRYANTQFARMMRREPQELLGQFCGDVLHPRLSAAERPCERNCPILQARTHGAARCVETLRLADDTTLSTVVVSAAPSDGRQVQLLRDESALEAARRARDSVLGNISHEFRTPLAAQLASIELLRDGLHRLPPEAHEELLANVERGVLRLMRLIDNLLESVRIESGQLAIRHQSVDLGEVVHEAAELIGPLFQQRGLTLDVSLAALPRPVPGDHQRLVQVLVNLLSNAAKYAPEGSAIRIAGRDLPGQVELWIEDEGPGISTDSTTVIFERFRRAAGAEPDAPGLGLGLWIVKSIMDRHDGSVRVERTAEQRTRFTLVFPLAPALVDSNPRGASPRDTGQGALK